MLSKDDLASYEGREPAYIKHRLLGRYLVEWARKVGSKWESLVYVDGFAGPWGVTKDDMGDSSFGIALPALRFAAQAQNSAGIGLSVHSVLVEKDPAAFAKLEAYATEANKPGFRVDARNGRFVHLLKDIDLLIKRYNRNPFKFVLLDPKGWKDIPLGPLKPFLTDRSCEVLINIMTKHITRFLAEHDRAKSYHNLFGRDDVLPILQKETSPDEKADVAVREYCKSLQQLCGFEYVSSAVILEPDKEQIRYFLVYATHSHHGVEVFKAAEMTAARLQDAVRHEAKVEKSKQDEFFFDQKPPKSAIAENLWRKYCKKAKAKMLKTLIESTERVPFRKLYCDAMAFPLVTPNDLHSWIDGLQPAVGYHLEGSPNRKKAAPDKNDRIQVIDRAALQKVLKSL